MMRPVENAPARRPLSPREQEIAGLVADGLTQREVARRLRIAPRTVAGVLAVVRLKLGVGSTAAVVAWVGASRARDAGTVLAAP